MFYIFFLIGISLLNADTCKTITVKEQKYNEYSIPNKYNWDDAVSLMIAKNGLSHSPDYDAFILEQPKDPIGGWCSTIKGVIKIPGTKKIEYLSLIDGPANIRSLPLNSSTSFCEDVCKDAAVFHPLVCKDNCKKSQKIVGTFPNNLLVRVDEQYKDWFLITDGANYGWTNKKNLRTLPKNKILLKNKIDDLSKTMDIYKNKVSLEALLNEAEKVMMDKKIKEGDPLLKSYCPQNITKMEADGFPIKNKDRDENDISSHRVRLYNICKGQTESQKITAVKMKAETCKCYYGASDDTYEEKNIDSKKDLSYFDESKGIFCYLSTYHVICGEEACPGEGDCSGPAYEIVCPKECMSWTVKK